MAKKEPPPEQGEILLEIPDEPPIKKEPPTAPVEIRSGNFHDYRNAVVAGLDSAMQHHELSEPAQELPEPILPPAIATPFVPPILSQNNRAKMERAKAHIEKLFLLAAAGLIEGVRFYGKISIEISWQDGAAQQISPSIAAKDQMLQ